MTIHYLSGKLILFLDNGFLSKYIRRVFHTEKNVVYFGTAKLNFSLRITQIKINYIGYIER